MNWDPIKQLLGMKNGAAVEAAAKALFQGAANRLIDRERQQLKDLIAHALQEAVSTATGKIDTSHIETTLLSAIGKSGLSTTMKGQAELAVAALASQVDLGAIATKGGADALAPAIGHINDLIDRLKIG